MICPETPAARAAPMAWASIRPAPAAEPVFPRRNRDPAITGAGVLFGGGVWGLDGWGHPGGHAEPAVVAVRGAHGVPPLVGRVGAAHELPRDAGCSGGTGGLGQDPPGPGRRAGVPSP